MGEGPGVSPEKKNQKWMQMVHSETVLADCVCLFFFLKMYLFIGRNLGLTKSLSMGSCNHDPIDHCIHHGYSCVAEWLSSSIAEQEDRGSIPGLAT